MRTMANEVFKILHEMCPPVVAKLAEKCQVHLILDVPIFCRSRQCTPVHLARDVLGTRHQCYGTHFQMLLENVQIFINLKV